MSTLSFDEVSEFFNLPTLNKHQKAFALTHARFPLAIGAPGSGKSVGGIVRSFLLSIDSPIFGNLSGNYGLIGRQSRQDLVDTTMADFLELIPEKWIKKHPVKPSYRMELINGSIIQFVPMEDLGRFKSRNLGWAFFEEIDEITDSVYEEVSLRRMRRKFTSLDNIIGFHTCFGVCNPTHNWVYDLWGLNEERLNSKSPIDQQEYDPDFLVIHSSVYENRQNLAEDYIPNLEKAFGDDEKKAQMYLYGAWGGTEREVYNWSSDLVNNEDFWPPLEWPTIIGLDHAYGAGAAIALDFLALEPLAIGRTKVHVYDEIDIEGREGDIETIAEELYLRLQFHAIQRAQTSGNVYPPELQPVEAVVYDWAMKSRVQRISKDQVEKTVIDTYIERCLEVGLRLGFVPANKSILPGIERMRWLINNELIRWNPRCRKGIKQHKNYVWDENHQDKIKSGQADHHPDATRYGVMSLDMIHHFPRESKELTLIERIKAKKLKARISSTRSLGDLICR